MAEESGANYLLNCFRSASGSKSYSSSILNTSVLGVFCLLTAGFFTQGFLAEWLLDVAAIEEDTRPNRPEELLLHGFMLLPLIVGCLMKYKDNPKHSYIADMLSPLGTIPPLIAGLIGVYNTPAAINPLYFDLPFKKWKSVMKRLGIKFLLKFLFLRARLSFKVAVLMSDSVEALRWYFVSRIVQNLLRIWIEDYTFCNFITVTLVSFCQDYMNVLGSSALISLTVKIASDMMLPEGFEFEKNTMLGFIPTSYIILGWTNIYFECDYIQRIQNVFPIFVFLVYLYCQFVVSLAWRSCVENFIFSQEHQIQYFSIFALLAVMPAVFAFSNTEFKARTIEINFSFGPSTPASDYQFVNNFGYQIAMASGAAFIAAAAARFFAYFTTQDRIEDYKYFENLIHDIMQGMMFVEFCLAMYVFDLSSALPNMRCSRMILIYLMALINAYCVAIERGYNLAFCGLFKPWQKAKVILDAIDPLPDDAVIEGYVECTICDSPVEDYVIYTNCKHMFHYECMRNWVKMGEVTCPKCGNFLNEEEDVDEVMAEQEVDSGYKIVSTRTLKVVLKKMEKWDNNVSVFSERAFEVEDEQKEEEEEEESDWEID